MVTSEALTARVLGAVREDRRLAAKVGSGFQGLGFRGVQVSVLGGSDDGDGRPEEFMIANAPGPRLQRGADLASALVKEMTRSANLVLPEHAVTPIDKAMQTLILAQLDAFVRNPPKGKRPPPPPRRGRRRTIGDATCDRCQYEISVFNPAFWNAVENVRKNNNCYNYARNWRTNTFAQPGRASGNGTNVMQCGTVSASAQSDGLVKRCKCLPRTEYPRRLMALVIAPGSDYHWYRHQIGGFWGHKPGRTAARNTDNSGVMIADPENCDRGPYTDFCGYFYAGKSVTII
ncbi:MAG TPA: hypothetical protein VK324_14305 [Tepidisphaeraceae bacterium]|nr:hypothetical protein [Tepidisphaeraceae bacterium]